MYETGYFVEKELLFFVYGLIFFSIGISILLQPRREKPATATPSFWLLGAFGILHGTSEWLVLWQIVEDTDRQSEALRLIVSALSFLCLFEFGRRVVGEAATYVHSTTTAEIARPHIAYLLPLIGTAILVFNRPGLAETEAVIRYTLAFPGAIMSSMGFLHYARVCEVAVNFRSARRGLHMAAFAFFAYAIAAGLVVSPSHLSAAQLINAAEFQDNFGVPIEVIRILIGALLLIGMARLIQTFNLVAFNRLREATGEAHLLRQRSALILDLVDDGVCGLDRAGNITFVNSAAKRMLGYDEAELLGMPFYTRRCCDPLDERYRDGSDPRRCPPFPHPDHYRTESEYLIRRDGSRFPVEYTSSPKYDGKRLTGAVLAFRDISERRHHEVAERWEQEERFDALFEQASVGIAVVALDGRCLQVNSRLSSILGYSSERMADSHFSEFIHPDEREECGNLRTRLTGESKRLSPSVEGRCIRQDGSIIWVQFSFTVVRDYADAPRYCFVAVEDISERKQAERIREYYQTRLEQQVEERTHALAQSNHELEAANRELESFSYSVSHDLRSPLRAINGYTHALVEDYGHLLDEAGLEYIERSRSATVKMGELIDCLLNLSNVFRSELTLACIDLSQLASELVDQLQQNDPDRRVAVHIEQDLKAEGDAILLRLLLQNLLSNAWKFTACCAQPSIKFGRTVCDGKVAYFVSDNGAGFEGEYVHKLFQPFERLHSEIEFEGMGIGLATVRRIVQRHNGMAWATGAVDEGATFYFTLPGRSVRGDKRQPDGSEGQPRWMRSLDKEYAGSTFLMSIGHAITSL